MSISDEIGSLFRAAQDRARLQTCADTHLADARERANDERIAHLPAGALRPVEIIEADQPGVDEVIGQLSALYDMTGQAVIDMLESFDYTEARVRHEVAA